MTNRGEKALAGKTIALMGMDPDIQTLVEVVFEEEKIRLVTLRSTPDPVSAIAATAPDLLIVSVGQHDEMLRILDELRAREETAELPVIVLGSLEPMQLEAQAGGNVYAVLSMPFELDDLVDAARAALGRTRFARRVRARPARPERAYREGAQLLARAERSLMLDWVQRIRTVEPFAGRPEISLGEFLDAMPRLLHAMLLILRHEVPSQVVERDPDLRERIGEHVGIRRRQGLGASSIAREYETLRHVLTQRLERDLPAEYVLSVLEELDKLLDKALYASLVEYDRLERGETPPA